MIHTTPHDSPPAQPQRRSNVFARIWHFYIEGFRNMTLGKTLWVIILIKLFVMFAILKVFFFPNFLSEQKKLSGQDESTIVGTELIERGATSGEN